MELTHFDTKDSIVCVCVSACTQICELWVWYQWIDSMPASALKLTEIHGVSYNNFSLI